MSDLCPAADSTGWNEAEDQRETLADANLRLLKQRIHCDVTFTFPNLPDRIEAHEIYLRTHSPVFEDLFQNWESGDLHDRMIEITVASPKSFQEFLEFIYTHKLETNVAGALDMLPLAQKYKVRLLTKECEELLKTDIKVKHCVRIFEAADRYGLQELKDQAGDFMVKHLAFLIGDSSLAYAEEDTILYLLERDDLTVWEVKLFEFLLEWGIHQIAPSSDSKLLKERLKKLTTAIRYTNMTPSEFNTAVKPTGFLSVEEMVSIFNYMATDEISRKDETIKFNTTPRNPEFVGFVDFYAGNEDPSPRSVSSSNNPLKLCISFQVQAYSKLWSGDVTEKPTITAVKIKWPTRIVQYTTLRDETLNFNLYIKDRCGRLSDQKARAIFEKNLLDCKGGHEDEIPIEPPVELISGVRYCIVVEDQAMHHHSPASGYNGVNYTYSGMFSPYDLSSETDVDLGVVGLNLTRIQKDNRLPGFSTSTVDAPINVFRGMKLALV